jgi:hypothetical protein
LSFLAIAVVLVQAVEGAPQGTPQDEAKARLRNPSKWFQLPDGARRLSPRADAWIAPAQKQVLMDGEICLRTGPLEMFACIRNTKEHESIVTVNTKAQYIHAALLALGAEKGQPAQFTPQYTPASGTEVEVTVLWVDPQEKEHSSRAQEWIRSAKTNKPLAYPWVFAGSGFWKDETTGREHYLAEGGDFICVSNFPSAMMDLPVESSQANEELLFEAWTEKIPEVGTRVRLVLTPKLTKVDNARQAKGRDPERTRRVAQ